MFEVFKNIFRFFHVLAYVYILFNI